MSVIHNSSLMWGEIGENSFELWLFNWLSFYTADDIITLLWAAPQIQLCLEAVFSTKSYSSMLFILQHWLESTYPCYSHLCPRGINILRLPSRKQSIDKMGTYEILACRRNSLVRTVKCCVMNPRRVLHLLLFPINFIIQQFLWTM